MTTYQAHLPLEGAQVVDPARALTSLFRIGTLGEIATRTVKADGTFVSSLIADANIVVDSLTRTSGVLPCGI
jgi:hypothetical protein